MMMLVFRVYKEEEEKKDKARVRELVAAEMSILRTSLPFLMLRQELWTSTFVISLPFPSLWGRAM
jgi:hypothetical protein